MSSGGLAELKHKASDQLRQCLLWRSSQKFMSYIALRPLTKLFEIPPEPAWNESMRQYQTGRIATDVLPDSRGCHLTLIAYKRSFCRVEDTWQVP